MALGMKNPVVFQIVGYQNSGKTTMMKKLIKELAKHNLTVATVKHHGHGGKPAVDGQKDSDEHFKSGAAASLVEGEGLLLLQGEKEDWTLDEKIQLLSFFEPDIILIEGHKRAPYPKGVIIRKEEDMELLGKLENIKTIHCWAPFFVEKKGTKTFDIHSEEGLQWIAAFLKNEVEKGQG